MIETIMFERCVFMEYVMFIIKSLVFDGLKLLCLRDLCVCVFIFSVYGIGCFFFRHINLSQYRVTKIPSVDIEGGYLSKSGARDAGVVFFVVVD
jgi:hypothetical protein